MSPNVPPCPTLGRARPALPAPLCYPEERERRLRHRGEESKRDSRRHSRRGALRGRGTGPSRRAEVREWRFRTTCSREVTCRSRCRMGPSEATSAVVFRIRSFPADKNKEENSLLPCTPFAIIYKARANYSFPRSIRGRNPTRPSRPLPSPNSARIPGSGTAVTFIITGIPFP